MSVYKKLCEIAGLLGDPKPVVSILLADGCDDIDGDPANFVNITRETTITDGVPETLFFTDYGLPTQAPYGPTPTFVDCDSGEPIPEEPPVPPVCEYVGEAIAFAPLGEQGVNVERWNVNAEQGFPITTVPSEVFVGPVDYSGMPAHDNGVPDGPIVVEPDLFVLDNTNDQSQMRGWTYLYLTEAMRIREQQGRAEAVDYFLGECCGEPVKAATGAYPNTSSVAFDVSLAAGIHYIGFEVFDFSAYSAVRYQYSTDNGVNWSNIPASWLYTAKPTIQECPVKVCYKSDGTSVCTDIKTGLPLGSEFTLKRPNLCGSTFVPSSVQCAPQTFYKVTGEIGTVEQQWLASAVDTSAAVGTSYLAGFTATDAEGYPAHANAADTTISSTIASTTNIVNTGAAIPDDQAQSDFWIWLTDATELREFNATAEASGVWIGDAPCSSTMTQVLDAPYTNTAPNPLGTFQPGFYRVRLYHSDATSNGITRLQALQDGSWASIPAYLQRPTVESVKGWYCDDGNFYNTDKSEILDPAEWLCEDPANCQPAPASAGAALPLTLRVAP